MKTKKLALAILCLSLIAPYVSTGAADLAPEPYYAEEKVIEIGGADIVCLDEGEGSAMVLVHGWAGNAWNWMSVFGELSKQHRVVVIDLPGHGKSGCPHGFGHTMREQAALVVEVMDELDIEKGAVVGSSMGGAIAAWTAIDFPERVDRLILVNAAGTSVQNPLMKMAGMLVTPRTVIPLIHLVFPVTEESLEGVPDSERKRVELAEELYASSGKRCAGRALARSMKSIARQTVDGRLPEIEAKTLIVWGSDDGLLPIQAGERYHQLIPHSELVVIEGGNHTPMQWTPKEFLEVVYEFLD